MKKLLMSIAVGTAILAPTLPAQATACVHLTNPPVVHPDECVAAVVDTVDGPYVGGCSFVAATDAVAGQGQMTGEIDIEAVVYPTVSMTTNFKCYIRVNGATQPGAIVTASGTVVVVGGGVITYTSGNVSDFVELCQDVDFNYDPDVAPTWDESQCFEASTFEIPPPVVWEIVDPPVCAVLAEFAGEYPADDPENDEGVYINQHGDVWIDGEGFWDCPIYGNVFGFPPNEN